MASPVGVDDVSGDSRTRAGLLLTDCTYRDECQQIIVECLVVAPTLSFPSASLKSLVTKRAMERPWLLDSCRS